MKLNGINQLNNIELSNDLGLFKKKTEERSESFKNMLMDAINKVNNYEKENEIYSMKIATGELDNIHEAMIAAQKADISMQFMLQVRNKVLDAYREIMRMQI